MSPRVERAEMVEEVCAELCESHRGLTRDQAERIAELVVEIRLTRVRLHISTALDPQVREADQLNARIAARRRRA